jgi:hypothetical protein
MGAADTNSFCIHQNTSGGIWVCYTFNPATYQISYCDKAYNVNDGSGKRGAEPSAVCTTASQFLGSAYSIGVPSFAPSSNLLLFSIKVTNCLNNTLATCQANGTSSDPANNPEVQVSGSVFPLQEGT